MIFNDIGNNYIILNEKQETNKMEKQEGKLYTHEGYFKKFMEDLHYKNYASIAKIFAPKRMLISLSMNFQKYPMLFIQGCVILSK